MIEEEGTDDNPVITVISPFESVTLPLSELTNYERSSLAGLLGLSGARKNAFESLRQLKKFKKIRKEEVWAKCPRHARGFQVEVDLVISNDTQRGLGDCREVKTIKTMLPEAEVSTATHTVHGFCPKCQREHSITRHSVMVKLVVSGVPMSNMYDLS